MLGICCSGFTWHTFYITVLFNRNKIITFYSLIPWQYKSIIKHTANTLNKELKVQNLRQCIECKNTTPWPHCFGCANECYKIKGFVYLCIGANLWVMISYSYVNVSWQFAPPPRSLNVDLSKVPDIYCNRCIGYM